MSVILVFDDMADERKEIADGLHVALKGGAEVMEFTSDAPIEEGTSFDHHIESWIEKRCAGKEVGLIVCDKELGRYEKLQGLSATPVSSVAMQMGLPFCQYSRQGNPHEREFERFKRLRQWGAEEITLEGEAPDSWVRQIAGISRGFDEIRRKYQGNLGETPAGTLAAILEHPEAESRIALYGSGEQRFLGEILAFYDASEPNNMDDLHKRMPRILGNWLLLSILRFPGILVNEVAAESYLNIAHEDFAKVDIRSQFAEAVYSGPFSDLGSWWWRAELDVLIGGAGCDDGLEYLGKRGEKVDPCLDPETGDRAGYYCMLTSQPVSAENSCGGINWFPSGADLAPIRKDTFNEITALVGMY